MPGRTINYFSRNGFVYVWDIPGMVYCNEKCFLLISSGKEERGTEKEEGRKAEEKICAENGLQAAPYVKEYCW